MTAPETPAPKRFRKKPVEVEASTWRRHGDHSEVGYYRHPPVDPATGEISARADAIHMGSIKHSEVPERYRREDCHAVMDEHGWIDTLEGGHTVCPGDWIIRGVQGELYPCKPNIFEATYEAPETSAPVPPTGAGQTTMTVRVANRGTSRSYEGVRVVTVTISARCPVCGGFRGVPRALRFCEDGDWYSVDTWDNPCGHVDTYAAVLVEAGVHSPPAHAADNTPAEQRGEALPAGDWEALRDELMAALRRCPCVVRPYPYGDKHRDECPRKGTIGARVDAIRPTIERVRAEARREALAWAADEVHREARWQQERNSRLGLHAYDDNRVLVVEKVIRDQIAREAQR